MLCTILHVLLRCLWYHKNALVQAAGRQAHTQDTTPRHTHTHSLVVKHGVQLSVGQAERAQACTAKVLHVLLRHLLELGIEGVLGLQALIDDCVGTLHVTHMKTAQQQPAPLIYCAVLSLANRLTVTKGLAGLGCTPIQAPPIKHGPPPGCVQPNACPGSRI